MPEILLRTKLFVPPLRPNLMPRPQLIAWLNQGLQLGHRLTLVSAPAGFGKTTLVSEWVATSLLRAGNQRNGRNEIAWLSLDEKDNDLPRFLAYLVAALNQAGSRTATVGKGTLNMLQASQPPPLEDLLTSLINDLATLDAAGSIILILDDYHLLESAPVDEALTFLLDHLPPQLHLVIVTRVDPGLPLARHRARGQLTELRATDLRFTPAEAAAFLNQVMGLDLSPADVATLEDRTEGWIAGLQLAAISMQGHADPAAFIESFSGSHRFVMDYLLEDVLAQQPQDVRTFLLQTAILDRLSGSLCDAVRFGSAPRPASEESSQAILEALQRANLFIIPLDEERRWYRYHRLFADLLRRRLRQTQSQSIAGLHRRASEWCHQHRFVDEAIEHALYAADFERAARLIEARIDVLWGRGEQRKLQAWLKTLPEEIRVANPYLSIFQARYQCQSGKLDAAEHTLERVEQALSPSSARASEPPTAIRSRHVDQRQLRGRVAATRAIICSYRGDVPGIIHYASEALAYLPAQDVTWRSVNAITLGNAYGFKGDMAAAYAARSEALQACEAAGDTYFIIMANLELAITLREQGQLQQTIAICRQQLQTARENGLSQARVVGWLLAVWGETLAERGDLNEALERAQEGFKLSERSRDQQMLGWSFMCLIRILISRHDLAEAEETIEKMEAIARERQIPPWIADQIGAWQARLWLAQNKPEAASRWARERGLDPADVPDPPIAISFFLLFDYVTLARILIAQGRLDQAAQLLQHLLDVATAGERTAKVIEIRILQALTLHAAGDTERALSSLEHALTLAEPEGFVSVFVDEGRPMARLLATAAHRGLAPGYLRRLLAATATDEPSPATTSATQPDQSDLVEPLSERELEVLRYVAEGLTNREIGERLYLSLNTIKVHNRNIFGKLGVNSRMQAVARARALDLLPAS